jgi:hypothetical protein
MESTTFAMEEIMPKGIGYEPGMKKKTVRVKSPKGMATVAKVTKKPKKKK